MSTHNPYSSVLLFSSLLILYITTCFTSVVSTRVLLNADMTAELELLNNKLKYLFQERAAHTDHCKVLVTITKIKSDERSERESLLAPMEFILPSLESRGIIEDVCSAARDRGLTAVAIELKPYL